MDRIEVNVKEWNDIFGKFVLLQNTTTIYWREINVCNRHYSQIAYSSGLQKTKIYNQSYTASAKEDNLKAPACHMSARSKKPSCSHVKFSEDVKIDNWHMFQVQKRRLNKTFCNAWTEMTVKYTTHSRHQVLQDIELLFPSRDDVRNDGNQVHRTEMASVVLTPVLYDRHVLPSFRTLLLYGKYPKMRLRNKETWRSTTVPN